MSRLWVRLSVSSVCVVVALAAIGCQKHAARPGDSATVQTAAELYRAGRYAEAKARAETDFRRTDGAARRAAALTAGLSCHAMGKTAEARGWLEPLLTDEDPAIAGRAGAAVGMIVAKQGEHARAAELLSTAASKLTGDDAARAALRAGHEFTAMSRFAEANSSYLLALQTAQSPALRSAIQPFTEPGPFAVQVGVFAARPNAERKASEIRGKATQLGFGAPRVVATNTSGKSGYSVRLGNFANRQAAAVGCGKLGTQAVVVAVD